MEGSMIRTIAIAFGLTALATSAIAADLPRKAPPPPPAPVYTWTGCYIGANLGWAQAETRFRFEGFDDGRHTASGVVGGGQVGCDYQFASNWVFGIQGIIDGGSLNREHISPLFPEDRFHSKASWFGTITARLGYLVTPSFLIYGKGGWGSISQRFTVTDTNTGIVLFNTGHRNFSGADAGVGFEWMFAPNWTLWVEWDHIFAQDKTVLFTPVVLDSIEPFTENIRRDFDKVLFGINWRFGGVASPVAARY
jgi:outer membrane immunogenic protein